MYIQHPSKCSNSVRTGARFEHKISKARNISKSAYLTGLGDVSDHKMLCELSGVIVCYFW